MNNAKDITSLLCASIFHNLKTECLWNLWVKCFQRKGTAVRSVGLLYLGKAKGQEYGKPIFTWRGRKLGQQLEPVVIKALGRQHLLRRAIFLRMFRPFLPEHALKGSWNSVPAHVQKLCMRFSDLYRVRRLSLKSSYQSSYGGTLERFADSPAQQSLGTAAHKITRKNVKLENWQNGDCFISSCRAKWKLPPSVETESSLRRQSLHFFGIVGSPKCSLSPSVFCLLLPVKKQRGALREGSWPFESTWAAICARGQS